MIKKFVLSVTAGLESIAKKEIEKQGGKIIETVDRLITFEGTIEVAAKVNLWSRVGNKVYMLLTEEENIEDFDDLYGLVNTVDFKKIIPKDSPIIVKATSLRSELHHTPTLQSITKKSIIDKLLNGEFWKNIEENPDLPKFEILVLMLNNTARILLNLSWEALHKRWYRREAWEAPIKESLAAGLVLLSGWRFKEPFYDIFCGSWTISIEAAMIAKNIAPWLKRNFLMVDLGFISEQKMWELKAEARTKKFDWDYRIFGSDIDEEMVIIAQKNASDAGVGDDVSFEKMDYKRALFKSLEKNQEAEGCLVTNPPYWLRLEADMEWLYKSIDTIFRKNPKLKWGFISNYMEFDSFAKKDFYKKRKLYNWAEKCYFWKRK